MKTWFLNLIGKKVIKDAGEKWGLSTGKLGAVIYVIIVAIQTIPAQFGHPIEIPKWVFDLLEALGLSMGVWGIRNSIGK